MKMISAVGSLLLAFFLALLAGCGGSFGSTAPDPLNASNLNLIFVVSPDLAYHTAGDIHPDTANLTSQGLQRSLLMATYLQQQVLGMKNVTGLYALSPMTHLQTANNYPDMAALTNIQQFAMINQNTLSGAPGSISFTGNSYPINVSYASGDVPPGVVTPTPSLPCPACQGLVFDDAKGNNVALVNGIIKTNAPGFHVFSAPWEVISRLLADINKLKGYNLPIPSRFTSTNQIYAITITPSGDASLLTYDSNISPPATYPALSPKLPALASCAATPFSITATGGVDGVVVPANANTNQTLYIVRHAEAHPTAYYGNGNYVAAGQWRALGLAQALHGKISPTQVYSFDPAQIAQGSVDSSGKFYWSNVAPSLTVQPYAIANNLPYKLVTNFLIADANSPQAASDFFFTGGRFSNQAVLLGWQFTQIPQTVSALLASYNYNGPPVPAWSATDYDSIWTLRFDARGNLTVNNLLCEGINSAALPTTAPQF
ncbi:MAG: hypothetical protein H6R04_494 [Burkholderiaceae bacterium]|nr:hypothetical protein [Burkholderiaceae bacterium]